ncbi:MAG: ABC transporter permease [Oscillospiraceae bacterium]|nr:ABC transporter permease [Oscillospiraceae bacterium]
MLDSILLCLKSLGKKRMRTFLTIFSITIGVASVLIISTVSEFGKTAVTSELDSLGLGGLAVSCSAQNGDILGISGSKAELISQVEGVDAVMPVIVQSSRAELRTAQSNCLIFGVNENADNIVDLQASYGRMIDKYDVLSGRNVCMIDAKLAKQAYYRANIVGKSIKLTVGGIPREFEVVGIVKTGTGLLQGMMGDVVPTFVYVPYSSLQKLSNRSDFDQITVKLKNGANVNDSCKQIETTLKIKETSGQSVKYHAENLSQQRSVLERLMNTVSLILSLIGLISLVVAGIGIMTIMMVSVNERTREIGIKKSIGAKRISIMLEFLSEALVLTLIGCIAGIALGMLTVFAGSRIFKIDVKPDFTMILFSIGISLAVGLIFGVYPALKAAKMKPVDALRAE